MPTLVWVDLIANDRMVSLSECAASLSTARDFGAVREDELNGPKYAVLPGAS